MESEIDNFEIDDIEPVNVKIIGVGGAGCDILNALSVNESKCIEYIAIEEAAQQTDIKFTDVVIIVCGLGGEVGTVKAPEIAAEAKAAGALTVAVAVLPPAKAGEFRMNTALGGLEELKKNVDSYIIIRNDRDTSLSFKENISLTDKCAVDAVEAICSMLYLGSGAICIDIDDVRVALADKGRAYAGKGVASGENRALQALEKAVAAADDVDLNGAYAALVNIAGNEEDLLMDEVVEIQSSIYELLCDNALIIDGITYDENKNGEITVSIVVSGVGTPKD